MVNVLSCSEGGICNPRSPENDRWTRCAHSSLRSLAYIQMCSWRNVEQKSRPVVSNYQPFSRQDWAEIYIKVTFQQKRVDCWPRRGFTKKKSRNMAVKVDDLSPASRDFYELTRLKLVASLVISSIGLMLLGFCAQDGGEAEYYKTKYDAAKKANASTNVLTALMDTSGGFGFAAFVFLIAAILTLVLAVRVSPICYFGTKQEQMMLRQPQELDAMLDGAEQGHGPSATTDGARPSFLSRLNPPAWLSRRSNADQLVAKYGSGAGSGATTGAGTGVGGEVAAPSSRNEYAGSTPPGSGNGRTRDPLADPHPAWPRAEDMDESRASATVGGNSPTRSHGGANFSRPRTDGAGTVTASAPPFEAATPATARKAAIPASRRAYREDDDEVR